MRLRALLSAVFLPALVVALLAAAASTASAAVDEPRLYLVDTAGADEAMGAAVGLLVGASYGGGCNSSAFIYVAGGEPVVATVPEGREAAAYDAVRLGELIVAVGVYMDRPAVYVVGRGGLERLLVLEAATLRGEELEVRGAFTAVAAAGDGSVYAAGPVRLGRGAAGWWLSKARGVLVARIDPGGGGVLEATLLMVNDSRGRRGSPTASALALGGGGAVYVVGDTGTGQGFVARLEPGLGGLGYAVLLDAGKHWVEPLAAAASGDGVLVAGRLGNIHAGYGVLAFILHLDGGGGVDWGYTMAKPRPRERSDAAVGAARLGDGGYLVLVDSSIPVYGASAAVLVRLDPQGRQLGYTVLKMGTIIAAGLAVDGDGTAWVAGSVSTYGTRGGAGFFLAAIPPAAGNTTLEAPGYRGKARITVYRGAWSGSMDPPAVAEANATLEPLNASLTAAQPPAAGCSVRLLLELKPQPETQTQAEATATGSGGAAEETGTAAAPAAGAQQGQATAARGQTAGEAAATPAETQAGAETATATATGAAQTGAEAAAGAGEAGGSQAPATMLAAAAVLAAAAAAAVVILRRR